MPFPSQACTRARGRSQRDQNMMITSVTLITTTGTAKLAAAGAPPRASPSARGTDVTGGIAPVVYFARGRGSSGAAGELCSAQPAYRTRRAVMSARPVLRVGEEVGF
jgi:hypothetical protein